MIRKLKQSEFKQAIDLSLKVFTHYDAEDFNTNGLETFKAFIYGDTLMTEVTMFGAFDRETLIGVLGINTERKHIYLFFINSQYHRQGIGEKLFNFAIQDMPMQEMTVNSSSYAITFYQRLGFEKTNEKQETNGLRYTPMKRTSSIRTPMIISKNNRYTLRTWEENDAESLSIQLNNKKIWDNCRDALPHPYHLENAQTILSTIRQKEGIHDFCIEVDGKAVGNIGFMPESDVQRFNAEVGYILGEPYWNQGIITNALQDAIHYYFDHTPIIRLFAFVFNYNAPSMRVLEKAGFSKIGVMKKSIYKNGEFWDAHYYELLKEE